MTQSLINILFNTNYSSLQCVFSILGSSVISTRRKMFIINLLFPFLNEVEKVYFKTEFVFLKNSHIFYIMLIKNNNNNYI